MRSYLYLFCFLLAACTSLPQAMWDTNVVDIPYSQVTKDIESHKDIPVRWGGIIISVKNLENFSLVQAIFYPLNYLGRPNLSSPHRGLFVFKSAKFIDPAVYVRGKEITVVGILNGGIRLTAGEKVIQVPLLLSTATHLWPEYYHKDYYDGEGYSGHYAGLGLGGCGLHICYEYESYPVIREGYYLPYRY